MTEQDAKLRLALRSYAAQLSTEAAPPPAAAVWLRARMRQREADLKRSAYPLRSMYALSFIAAMLVCAWLLYAVAQPGHTLARTTALHSSAAKWLLTGFLAALAGWTLLFRATQRLFAA